VGEIVCGSAARSELTGPARLLFGLRIDPNLADAITLETLPRIGPVHAQAIISERCRRPFVSVADLRRVPGIGPKTVDGLAPYVAIGTRLAACEATSVRSQPPSPEPAKENR
jgi:hypothetical protein